jgi:hypothetical protein
MFKAKDWKEYPKKMIQTMVHERVLNNIVCNKKWYNHLFEWLEILLSIGWGFFCMLGLYGGFYVSVTLIKKFIWE